MKGGVAAASSRTEGDACNDSRGQGQRRGGRRWRDGVGPGPGETLVEGEQSELDDEERDRNGVIDAVSELDDELEAGREQLESVVNAAGDGVAVTEAPC